MAHVYFIDRRGPVSGVLFHGSYRIDFLGMPLPLPAGKYDDKNAKGDVSSFQALSAAVAATVGLGNISGVAIAIHDGGPGVVFWIWMTALIGMCIKFYSCSLSIMFRGTDSDGKLQGGPMYYITQGMGQKARPLAVFFCICGLFGFLGVFTANQFTETFMSVVNPTETLWETSEFNWKLPYRHRLGGHNFLCNFWRIVQNCQGRFSHCAFYGTGLSRGSNSCNGHEFGSGLAGLENDTDRSLEF